MTTSIKSPYGYTVYTSYLIPKSTAFLSVPAILVVFTLHRVHLHRLMNMKGVKKSGKVFEV